MRPEHVKSGLTDKALMKPLRGRSRVQAWAAFLLDGVALFGVLWENVVVTELEI